MTRAAIILVTALASFGFFLGTAFCSESYSLPEAKEIITNPLRSDGFGAQFQTIIYSVIYAELKNKCFYYTPFVEMGHNYNNEVTFLADKEILINFIGSFKINQDENIQSKYGIFDFINFFEGNLEACANSRSLKLIKRIFRSNKNNDDYFNRKNFNVAIHVRRPNSHDIRVDGTDTPDEVYSNIINLLRSVYQKQNPLFHIYSQGDIDSFKIVFNSSDIVLHINESVEQTFTSLVLADALVTSRSSLSYTAGLLSEGVVYYLPFWHPPLPNWITIGR